MLRAIQDIPHQIELVRWTVYVFLAGMIYSVALWAIIDLELKPFDMEKVREQATRQFQNQTDINNFVQQASYVDTASKIAFPIMGVGILPIILSYGATNFHPEKRIVPPFFIQLIAAGVLLFLWYQRILDNPFILLFAYLGTIGVIVIGVAQDRFIIWLLGIAFYKKQLKTYVLEAEATRKQIEEIILTERVRDTLNFRRKARIENDRFIIRTMPRASFSGYLELKEKTNNETGITTTIMNLVFFEKGRYYTKTTPALEEYAEQSIAYLKRLLIREPYRIYSEEIADAYPEELVEKVSADLLGARSQAQGLTLTEKIRIAIYGGSIFLIGVYGALTNWNAGIITMIAAAITFFGTEASLHIAKTKDSSEA